MYIYICTMLVTVKIPEIKRKKSHQTEIYRAVYYLLRKREFHLQSEKELHKYSLLTTDYSHSHAGLATMHSRHNLNVTYIWWRNGKNNLLGSFSRLTH